MVFEGIVYVVLTHDIDWSRQGPGSNYIIARRTGARLVSSNAYFLTRAI